MSDPKVVASRQTFDGITVFLHEDGSISDRLSFIGRRKLPVQKMWRYWEDIVTYKYEEIGAFIKAANDDGRDNVQVGDS